MISAYRKLRTTSSNTEGHKRRNNYMSMLKGFSNFIPKRSLSFGVILVWRAVLHDIICCMHDLPLRKYVKVSNDFLDKNFFLINIEIQKGTTYLSSKVFSNFSI